MISVKRALNEREYLISYKNYSYEGGQGTMVAKRLKNLGLENPGARQHNSSEMQ